MAKVANVSADIRDMLETNKVMLAADFVNAFVELPNIYGFPIYEPTMTS